MKLMSTTKPKNPFSIPAQYIKDISFENILVASDKPKEIKGEPEILVNANVNTKALKGEKNTYEVDLKVMATAQEQKQKIFIAEVTHIAIVQFDSKFVEENSQYIDPTLCIEIPFYLFFEVRNLIANMSHMGGFPPIFVRPVDFGALYQSKMQSDSEGVAT